MAGFLVAIPLYTHFDAAAAGFQFVELAPWIERFNVNYHLGVDGISVPLILLNCFTTVLVVLAAWQVIQTRVAQYMAAFLVLSGLMNGVFAALDGLLFSVFFEATLIPMFIIIGVWAERTASTQRSSSSSTRCSAPFSRWSRSSISTTPPAAASRCSSSTSSGSG